ncbi:MAG: HAMP domain-containing protein, partial [Candidatus Riflebacteria bacterium]|nr:HAMP domain-containing protein [Candidatus Riflebacteria bacterium]
MEKIIKTGENSYIKFLPTYFITIIIPALFGLFLCYLILEIDKNNEIETIKSKLSERATDFMIKTTPLDYFKPHFSNLADKLIPYIESNAKKDEFFKYNLSQEIDDFNKKLNINIRYALFESNSLINEQALEDYEQRFFTYAWKSIHNIENADYKNRIVDQGQILGVDFNPEIMNNYSEYCLPTFSFGKKGLFYFKDSKNKNNGVIIFVEYSKTGLEIIEDKIKDYSTYEQPIIMYDIKSRSIKSSTLGHKAFTYSQINTEEFLDGIINKNILWKCFNSDDYKLLFGQIITQPHKYLYKFIFTSIIALILIVIISFFFFKNVSEKGGLYVSIRYKLIFIFALAIYMPTLSLWVLSHSTINYYRTSIENSVQKGMLDVLNKIDNDYKNKEEEIRDCFYKLDDYLRSFGGKEPPKKEEIEQKLQEIVGKEKKFREIFQWLDIWNINQTQIYTTSNNDSNSRIGEISRVIELLCLDKYCPDRLSYAGVKLNQSDIMIGNLLENPISGFSFIFERPRQITFHNFNEIGSYWFWNYYPDKTNPVSFCFGNTDCNDNIVSYFHSISKNRFSLNQTNLLLVNLHFSAQKFIPDTARNWKDLIELISLSNVNKTIEFSTVNYENKKYLCICKPGSLLRGCFSLCLYPTSEIDYQINKVRITIYYVIILLLIIAIFTGLLLAQNFITPIKELNNGLVALQKRETNYTIKIENNDELGQLGNTFNQMMQEIKDMLLAEAIQQCLIPTGEYKKDNYDCLIYNQ